MAEGREVNGRTNFYQRYNISEDGSEYFERHIGKRSGGWEFSFRGYDGRGGAPKIRSWADWKFHLLKEGRIFDEYGTEYTAPEFVTIVEKTKGEKNHYDYSGYIDPRNDWQDQDGWSFSATEFC
jgi:hypothetical protein